MTSSTALTLGGELTRVFDSRAAQVTLRLRTVALAAPSDDVFSHDGVDVLLLPRAFATAYPRERFYADRWAVITRRDDAPVDELISRLPHVVFDSGRYRVRPYEVLDERGVTYSIRTRVSDQLLIPHLVAGSGGIAFHRHHVASRMSAFLGLAVHEFPYPIEELGIDLVWNPWLADDGMRAWLDAVLREAAVATGHDVIARPG